MQVWWLMSNPCIWEAAASRDYQWRSCLKKPKQASIWIKRPTNQRSRQNLCVEIAISELSCPLFYWNLISITNLFLSHDADLFLEISLPNRQAKEKPNCNEQAWDTPGVSTGSDYQWHGLIHWLGRTSKVGQLWVQPNYSVTMLGPCLS